MSKTAPVRGVPGQNGSHVAELLLHKGYRVAAESRRASTRKRMRLSKLRITESTEFADFDLPKTRKAAPCKVQYTLMDTLQDILALERERNHP